MLRFFRKSVHIFIFCLLVNILVPVLPYGIVYADTGVLKDIKGHWAQNDIQMAVNSGYVKGYTDSTFRPDNQVNRAEFVTMVNAAFSIPVRDVRANFNDVQVGSWFASGIQSAVEAGYVTGYNDNTFRPYQSISREEASSMIFRLTKLQKGNSPKNFYDSNRISQWAKQAVDVLSSNGIITGRPDGCFYPDGTLSRAEAVVIINRVKNILPDGVVNPSPSPSVSPSPAPSVTPTPSPSVSPSPAPSTTPAPSPSVSPSPAPSTTPTPSPSVSPNPVPSTTPTPGPSLTPSPSPNTDPDVGTGSEIVTNKLIVIDPGHGGSETGAIGPGGSKEKDINLAIALKVAEYLRNTGFEVIMTRASDKYVSLIDRSILANNARADIFVSIHCNAFNGTVGGTETLTEPLSGNPVYKQQENSKKLARLIQNGLVSALGLYNRGAKEQGLSVCRETNAPAALVEVAFIDNPNEEKLLNNSAFQDKAARAIALGIYDYFN